MSLENRVALITGAAQGLGKSIAERLANDGATVIVADLNLEKAEQTAAEIRHKGHDAIAIMMNVASEESINVAMEAIESEKGKVTILVNNAGILNSAPAQEMPLESWQRHLDIMLSGSLLCARAVLTGMVDEHWGRIINMGSLMSFTSFGGDAAYCTTKAGMLGLTRSLAMEFGPHNICVNAICPGNILTEMLENVGRTAEKRDGLAPGEFLKQRAETIPLRRLGAPEDIANMVGFLCSEDASYVSGQSLHVNGALYLT